jgi:hypothetical protein
MTVIRPATLADLDRVSRYVAKVFGRDSQRYRRSLDYRWFSSKTDIGALIEDENKIRGFVGAIYSERVYGDQCHRLCNLTSIAVDESHRKLTLQLFNALFRRNNLTFTCFSASERVAKILDFFKFQRRESAKLIVGPLTGLGALRATRGRPCVKIITDPLVLEVELQGPERQIARDHRPYRCGQLLLMRGDRRCYVVTARRGRDVRAFADVLYASDPELLIELLPWIHGHLFRTHGTVLTGIETRWIPRRPLISFVYSKLRPVYVKSRVLVPDVIDGLYSELVPGSGLR